MILLFGTKGRETLLSMVTFACHYCGLTAPQRVFKRATWFTLFFIPLFPVSTRYFVECANCAGTTALTQDQAQHSIEWAVKHVNSAPQPE